MGSAGAGALVERLRIHLLVVTAGLLAVSLFYAFVRRPTRRNKIVAVTSVVVAVAATIGALARS